MSFINNNEPQSAREKLVQKFHNIIVITIFKSKDIKRELNWHIQIATQPYPLGSISWNKYKWNKVDGFILLPLNHIFISAQPATSVIWYGWFKSELGDVPGTGRKAKEWTEYKREFWWIFTMESHTTKRIVLLLPSTIIDEEGTTRSTK